MQATRGIITYWIADLVCLQDYAAPIVSSLAKVGKLVVPNLDFKICIGRPTQRAVKNTKPLLLWSVK
jgi:hypothetical protein